MEALVTVTDEKYFAGTQVLFYSFLKHHPNYKGHFVVIHDDLPQQLQKELATQFSVQFEQVSKTLKSKLIELAINCPQISNRLQRFWSLELFRLTDYKKVLFLDSDILCKGNLYELLSLKDEFSAVADLSYYREKGRDRLSFELKSSNQEAASLKKTFNAGVILLNQKENPSEVYTGLLNLLNSNVFEKVSSGHTDQYLLNIYFENKVNWLDARYNYILREEKFIIDKTGIPPHKAILWHYIRNPKPWNLKRLLKNRLKGKENPEHAIEWHQIYREFLQSQQVSRLKLLDKILLYALKFLL